MKGTRKLKTTKKKEKKRLGWAVLFAVLGIFLAGSIVYASRASALRVTSVHLVGETAIPEESVQSSVASLLASSYLGIFPKNNAIIYPRTRIEESLRDEFPRAEKIKVELVSLSELGVTVIDRTPAFKWCGNEAETVPHCYLLDMSGYLYAQEVEGLPVPVPRVYGPLREDTEPLRNFYLAESEFRILGTLLTVLREGGFVPTHIRADSREGAITTEDGWTIRFLFRTQPEKLLSNLKTVLKNENVQEKSLDYIDLRFGNKIFYKFKE